MLASFCSSRMDGGNMQLVIFPSHLGLHLCLSIHPSIRLSACTEGTAHAYTNCYAKKGLFDDHDFTETPQY